jgi:hypothetical protein
MLLNIAPQSEKEVLNENFVTSLAVTLSYAGEALHFDGELLSLSLKVILHLQALLLSILSTSGEKQKILRIIGHKMNLKKRSIVDARGTVRKLLASRFFHLPTTGIFLSLS